MNENHPNNDEVPTKERIVLDESRDSVSSSQRKSRIPVKTTIKKTIRTKDLPRNPSIRTDYEEKEENSLNLSKSEKEMMVYEKLKKECKGLQQYLQQIMRQKAEMQQAFDTELSIYQAKIRSLSSNQKNLKQNIKKSIFPGLDKNSSADGSLSYSSNQLQSLSSLNQENSESEDNVKEMNEISIKKTLKQKQKINEEKKQQMKIELEKQKKQEVVEAQTEMNDAVQGIEMKNLAEMRQLKEYYTQITSDNLQKMQYFKLQIAKLKPEDDAQTKNLEQYEKQKKEIEKEYKLLAEETERMRERAEEADKVREELKKAREQIAILEDEKENELIAQEVLSNRFLQLEEERDDLYERFEEAIKDVRQRTEFRGFILEQKIKEMNENLDQKERVLRAQVSRNQVDSSDMSKTLDNALIDKNARIAQLEDQLKKMHQSYEKMVDMYEAKISKFGNNEKTDDNNIE